MPLYNVELTMRCTIVVQADELDDVTDAALYHWRDAVHECDTTPVVNIRGEVRKSGDLRDGWDEMCVPYNGDGNTRIRDLLTPKGD